jgi:hypothetical protein
MKLFGHLQLFLTFHKINHWGNKFGWKLETDFTFMKFTYPILVYLEDCIYHPPLCSFKNLVFHKIDYT